MTRWSSGSPSPASASFRPLPQEEERPRRARSGKERARRKGAPRREDRREYEYGAVAEYNLYDASSVPTTTATVKLGDLYGDLLASLGLEEEAEEKSRG